MAPELKELLRNAAAQPSDEMDLEDVRRRAATVRRGRHLRTGALSLAALALIAVAAMPLLDLVNRPTVDFADRLPNDSEPTLPGAPEGPGVPPEPWERLPPAPIAPRSRAAAVWSGTEVLFTGGWNPTGEGEKHVDGAAYDPATETWRRIADAPVAAWGRASSVWTGSEMIVWGWEGDGHAAAAAYDPAFDRWRRLPSSPVDGAHLASTVWTGKEMLVWGGYDADGAMVTTGAAYNPKRDSWRKIAASPVAGRADHGVVWTGTEMVVWGGRAGPSPDDERLADGAAYNPRTDRWRVVADGPLGAREPGAVVWSGSEMLVLGGYTSGAGAPSRGVAAWDPDRDRWRRLSGIGLAGITSFVWAGDQVLAWGPDEPTPLALGPRTGAGSIMGTAPGRLGTDAAAVDTGTQVVIWGGHDAAGNLVDEGGIFNSGAYPMTREVGPPPDPPDRGDNQPPPTSPGNEDSTQSGGAPLWPPDGKTGRWRKEPTDTAEMFGRTVLGWSDARVTDGEPSEDGRFGERLTLSSPRVQRSVGLLVVPTKTGGRYVVESVNVGSAAPMKVALSVSIRDGRAQVIFDWPRTDWPDGPAPTAELALQYGDDRASGSATAWPADFRLPLGFSTDRPGSLLILVREQDGTIIGAQGTGIPAGDFAAG